MGEREHRSELRVAHISDSPDDGRSACQELFRVDGIHFGKTNEVFLIKGKQMRYAVANHCSNEPRVVGNLTMTFVANDELFPRF